MNTQQWGKPFWFLLDGLSCKYTLKKKITSPKKRKSKIIKGKTIKKETSNIKILIFFKKTSRNKKYYS